MNENLSPFHQSAKAGNPVMHIHSQQLGASILKQQSYVVVYWPAIKDKGMFVFV